MAQTVTNSQALRIMGVWLRRADAVLAHGGAVNAAAAVAAERERQVHAQRDLADLDRIDLNRMNITQVSA
jgi:hypothetical protein